MSRKDQKLEPQRGALLVDGCKRVFEEKVSSQEAERKAARRGPRRARRSPVSWGTDFNIAQYRTAVRPMGEG